MPIFEYKCNKCGHVTAFLEKAAANFPHACEKCGSTDTQKALSTFAAQSGKAASSSCPTGTCPFS